MARRDPIENARDKIAKFLRRESLNSTDDETLTSVELRHFETKRSLGVWKCGEDDPVDIEVATEEMLETAQEDADGLGDAQEYAIVSYYNNGPRFANSSAVFRIRGEDDPDTDTATLRKKLGKDDIAITALKALSDCNRMLLSERGAANAYLVQALDTAANINQQLSKSHVEIVTERENLLDKQAERTIEAEKEAQKLEIQADLFEHAKLFLPAIGGMMYSKLSGKAAPKLLNGKNGSNGHTIDADPGQALFEGVGQLMSTMTEEQLYKFASVLSPAQQVGFKAILDSYAKFAEMKAGEEEQHDKQKKQRRKRRAKRRGSDSEGSSDANESG